MKESDKVSVIMSAQFEAAMAGALIIKVDSAFNNDKSLYELIFLEPIETNSVLVSAIKNYVDAFPIRLAKPSDTLNTVEGSVVVLSDKLLEIEPNKIGELIRFFHSHRKSLIIAYQQSVLFSSLKNISKLMFSDKPLSLKSDDIRKSDVLVFQKSLLASRQITLQEIITDRAVCLVDVVKRNRLARIDLSKLTVKTPVISNVQRKISKKFREFTDIELQQRGAGFYYKGKEYITHNTLDRRSSAVERTTASQRYIILGTLLLVAGFALLISHTLLVAAVTIITLLYALDLLFNLFLIYRSYKAYSEITISETDVAMERIWPAYTILCPLYKESSVVPQFIAAMRAIDYPVEKLEVMLLLEEDDTETIQVISNMELPPFFKVIIVPDSMPKTKPKACNYGLIKATGEYAVIYDAEDIPDPLQLKMAVLAFENGASDIGCIQAKLNYYNWDQNLLTRLFTLEYSLWFNLVLTGLQSIKAPIPLGGTSNHFRVDLLRQLGGWDPFNVTEDADLGIRLAKRGMKTAILDSTTLEEANSQFTNWLKQRSRWIKGYMQTYLVHMRDLKEFRRNSRIRDMFTFQLAIGGKIVSMLINPILWIMTIGYFVFRPITGPFIESLYLTPIFYIGATSLIIGNFLYLYYYMMGAARQNRPELIFYALFVPLYWLMMSLAALMALRDLIIRPFHWQKTKHGLHLKNIKKSVV